MRQFYRIAAGVPQLRVGDVAYNMAQMRVLYQQAVEQGASWVVFPELSITGATCGDWFRYSFLGQVAEQAIQQWVKETATFETFAVLGVPLWVSGGLYNAALVVGRGRIWGITLKDCVGGTTTTLGSRGFDSGIQLVDTTVDYAGQKGVPIGTRLLYRSQTGVCLGIEIGDTVDTLVPLASELALAGAQVVLNPVAAPCWVGRSTRRRQGLLAQSVRMHGLLVHVGAGVHESSTEAVYDGSALMAWDGRCLSENQSFSRDNQLIFADINPDWVNALRRGTDDFIKSSTVASYVQSMTVVELPALTPSPDLGEAGVTKSPYLSTDPVTCDAQCHELFELQVVALLKRMTHTQAKRLVIGISGGLDSTLALLVCAKACDEMGVSRELIDAVTMPGFGTSVRTKSNAERLAKQLGIPCRKISIRRSVALHFREIGHDPTIKNVVYENAQARERTQILMDIANAESGLLVGTGDLSEIALGWSTFNGDHMSMYNVNASVPKTLMQRVVRMLARTEFPAASRVLIDIVETPISPELLPGKQETEHLVGRYEIHDFFLYYLLKYGETPEGLLALAQHAFGDEITREELERTLRIFLKRFVTQQFKRNAAPDGPQVIEIGLSARNNWVAPSDMSTGFLSPWL